MKSAYELIAGLKREICWCDGEKEHTGLCEEILDFMAKRLPKVGEIVIYKANKLLPTWHDRGFEPRLPGIVVKVWSSGAVNLRVADVPIDDTKIDLKVFLDHNGKDSGSFVWVFGATYGDGQDQWRFPEEVWCSTQMDG